MFMLLRVLLLGVVVCSVIGSGYLMSQVHLHAVFDKLWQFVSEFINTFDITVVVRALMVWFKRMGTEWLLIEVPKRLLIISLLPYVLLWLLPRRLRRRLMRSVKRLQVYLVVTYRRVMKWLRAEHMFGPYAMYAIGLLVALVFFVFFYSVFWVYVALWLGFVKIPAVVIAVLSFIWGKLLHLIEKIPFGTVLFRWTNAALVFLSRIFPFFHFIPKTPAERRAKARARARAAIVRRKHKELFLRVGPLTYRRFRRAEKEALKQQTKEKQDPPR